MHFNVDQSDSSASKMGKNTNNVELKKESSCRLESRTRNLEAD
jgi:hypothetical protein